MDCFGTYLTHGQTCDNVRVQSATQWTASVHTLHMPKPVITFVFKSATQWTASVHTSHMPKPVITFVFKSATQWTASVHTLRMPKPVITFVFKSAIRNGLLRYIYFTHVAICDNVPVGRTFEWFWVAAQNLRSRCH